MASLKTKGFTWVGSLGAGFALGVLVLAGGFLWPAGDPAAGTPAGAQASKATEIAGRAQISEAALAALKPGHWYEVPNSHLRSAAVLPAPAPAQYANEYYRTKLAGLMTDWNGGAFDTKRNCLMVWGGGHVSYTGNEVYSFCLGSLTWARVTKPAEFGNWHDGDVAMPDGTPVTAQSRDGMAYLPNIDKFFVFGAYTFKTGKGAAAWLFDPKAKKWTRLPPADNNLNTAFDPVTGKVYAHNNYRLLEWDPVRDVWVRRLGGGWTWPFSLTMTVDPKNHNLVAIGGGRIFVYNLDNPKPRWDDSRTSPLTSGDKEIEGAQAPGFEWDPVIGKFVAWKGGAEVYTLDPKTWVWTKIGPAADNKVVPTAPRNGTYGLFRYVPSRNLFITVNSVDGDVYLYRLDDATAAVPTPVPPPIVRFSAQPTYIKAGGLTVLTWRTQNAKVCTASGGWSGDKPSRGRVKLTVATSGAFRLSCRGEGGTTEAVAYVKIPTDAERNDGVRYVCPRDNFDLKTCEYQSLGAALAVVKAGETIRLAPGVYRECGVVKANGVTIEGKGAHLKGVSCGGKAALVWQGKDGVLDGIECSGIRVSDRNGACVRIETPSLTIRNVYFHDNEQGVVGGTKGGTYLIENATLRRNGNAGRAHGIYIANDAAMLTVRGSRILSGKGLGHDIKSRALRTVIENNVIAGLDGNNSRAIDIPFGGDLVIRDNVIEKGPNSDNMDMIGIAREGGGRNRKINKTLVAGNLFIFDRPGMVFTSDSPGKIVFRNNRVVGTRKLGTAVIAEGNKFFDTRQAAGLAPYPALPQP